MPIKLIPFSDTVVSRPQHEKIDDEVYRSIPGLNALATPVQILSKKLSLSARNALFYMDRNADPSLRRVAVELGVERQLMMEGAEPDLGYLQGEVAATRKQFETPNNDIWVTPEQ
ncbi:hypothetical protein [Ralstonia sp. ASV6]|uniref:hypothetical protein n=1 Tax=Ralstonia sp. ASV6 TaxID=2795124 RepID=UPI0018EBB11E|nr:hypothetical protein [Ralstonia sp. ASV6]